MFSVFGFRFRPVFRTEAGFCQLVSNSNDVVHKQYPVNDIMCTVGVLCTASRYLAVRSLVGLLLVCVSVFGFRFRPVFRTEAGFLSARHE